MRDTIVAVGVALLVLSAAAAGTWALLDREEPDPEAEAAAFLDDYVAVWERWDTTAMGQLVRDESDDFAVLHEQMRTALEPATTTISRGPVTLEGSEARAPVTVALELPYADTFSYDTELVAQRVRGEWSVLFEPATLHPDLGVSLSWRVDREEATRAPILAHDGTPLTSPGDLHTIGLWPARIEDPAAVQAAFDRVVPGSSDDVADLLDSELNPDWFYPVATLRVERFEDAWSELSSVPGVVQRSSEQRLAPTDGFALHVLGSVETLDEDGAAERGPPYEAGDHVGRYGLEAAFEERLRGSGVIRIVLVEPDDEIHQVVHEFEGDPAEPVTTTLDLASQRALENALVGSSGSLAVAVLHAPSGALRAVASRPLTGYNRAFEGRYPPGSTFKIVTAAAALSRGWSPEDEIACPAEVRVGGRLIRNLDGLDLGEVTLTEAFAASCNTSFALLADEVGGEALVEVAGWFGFGTELELPLPAASGQAPPPGDGGELAEAAIGQGRVETSVLHLASVAAAVSTGVWRAPSLLAEADAPTVTNLTDQVAGDLRSLMQAVVTDGTGNAADLDGVHGKTGSAEAVVDGRPVTHAWFVAFRGDVAVAVLVEEGGSGGEVAAPLAARVLRELEAAGAGGTGGS